MGPGEGPNNTAMPDVSKDAVSTTDATTGDVMVTTNTKDANGVRVSSGEVTRIMREQYANLNNEEKVKLDEHVKELEARRNHWAVGLRNVGIATFHDMRITFDKLHHELSNLNARTGTEIIMIGVCGSLAAYNKPAIYYSNERVRKFFEDLTGATLLDLGIRMEGLLYWWCRLSVRLTCALPLVLTTLLGAITNQLERTLLLKAQLASLILTKARK